MSLATLSPVGFLPTTDAAAARVFYEQTLGLPLVADDGFAMEFRLGLASDTALRIVRVQPGQFAPTTMTLFGWETPDIAATVRQLGGRGVAFERYPYFEQDDLGIWTAPDGDRVAWFRDPSGNVLSVSQRAPRTGA